MGGVRWVRSAVLVVGLALAGPGAVPVAAADGSSPAFATPDEAVRAYLAGVAAADLAQIDATLAADEMAAGFDFVAHVDRLSAFLPYTTMMPVSDPLSVGLNESWQRGQTLSQTRTLIYSLLTDAVLDGSAIAAVDAAWAQDFMAQVDLDRLAGLEVLETAFPDPEYETNPRYLDNAARQAAMYGADELTERLALIELEGRRWLVGFTLLRYGDSWAISSQTSALGRTSSIGVALPVPDGS